MNTRYCKRSILIDTNGNVVGFEWDYSNNYKALASEISPIAKKAVDAFKSKWREVVVGCATIVSALIISVSVTYKENSTFDKHVKSIKTEVSDAPYYSKPTSHDDSLGNKVYKPIVPSVVKPKPKADSKYSIWSAFKTQKTITDNIKSGSNLTKMKGNGRIHAVNLSEQEIEYNVCALYSFIKERYQNKTFAINALAKTSQVVYETMWFKSVLFNYAGNVGGQKNFSDNNYVLALDDKTDCVSGEYPYSRFKKYDNVIESVKYGCEKLLQSPRYNKKNSHYLDAKSWIKSVANGGYATNSDYANTVMAVSKRVTKILSKHGLI